MPTFLFESTIFGPVKSRRLGNSLGINLLPNNKKICNYNCLYCECGWNSTDMNSITWPNTQFILLSLAKKLEQLKQQQILVDTITFAGNGEPTMHPSFSEIIDGVIKVRNEHYPKAKIAVLSNATLIFKETVKQALLKVDYNILKLDSGIEKTIKLLNQPTGYFELNGLVKSLKIFSKNCIIQTMFVKGYWNGSKIDNTSDEEISAWLNLIQDIQPNSVMIYSIARETPIDTIKKVSKQELESIAIKIKQIGIPVHISSV